ncbi:MAG: hypothetical protein KDA96_04740 [Planctomycetaceae bacterium]|nr:hypothetical protein [Planctomycetaceae bacterium]
MSSHESSGDAVPELADARVDIESDIPRPTWWSLLAAVLMVVAADLTLYRAEGMMGPAVYLPTATVLILLGTQRNRPTKAQIVVLILIAAASVRLAWSGHPVLVCRVSKHSDFSNCAVRRLPRF